MIFTGIRLLVCAFIFFVSHRMISKSEKIVKKKKWSIVALVFCAVLASALCLLPIENAFVTFKSPYEAYNYSYDGEVVLVIEGETTTKVIAKDGYEYDHKVLLKSDKGWKLPGPLDEKMVGTYYLDDLMIMVTKYKDTDEYYLGVISLENKELKLSDSKGTTFLGFEKNPMGYYTSYYAYVKGFDNEYTLNVNGKSICIVKDMRKNF